MPRAIEQPPLAECGSCSGDPVPQPPGFDPYSPGLGEKPEAAGPHVPVELLSGVEHRLRHFPVEPNPREPERAIRFGERAAEPISPLPVPEDTLELPVVHADQPSSRVEVRLDRVLLAVLREKVGQRSFAETF